MPETLTRDQRELLNSEPFNHPQLRDVIGAAAKLQILLMQFRAWQTNYPASRPELWEPISQLMDQLSGLQDQLIGLRENHQPTLDLEKFTDARSALVSELRRDHYSRKANA